MKSRHKARETALQTLFQEDFVQEPFLNSRWIKTDEEDLDFARQLVCGVFSHHQEIDRLIEKHTDHWSPDRITPVDRNVLRIAVFEISFLKETPPAVIINEAIEIAKKYGNENSGAFVNGVIDSITGGGNPPRATEVRKP